MNTMPGRGFRYVKKENTKRFPDHVTSFNHVMQESVTHTGIQQTIVKGTTVSVDKVVACANGVWFKTNLNGTPIWFLGHGSRSYKTIYEEQEQEKQG